jgi:ectoine hydroxylase-related dioxygenase (phytanoyl-CoA dioxygenase family)
MYGEPPVAVLEQLLAVRVHFDPSNELTGALYVVKGTHLRGRISETELSSLPSTAYTPCCAAAGDLVFIKPLLVHRSAKSTSDSHRRVLHVVYAPNDGWHARP